MLAGTDIKRLMKLARRAGWTVEQRKTHSNSHWLWVTPDGRAVLTTSHTPSDHNAVRQVKSCLKREGVL